MIHEMIFSGFGGQGIMLMGQLMAQAGLEEGLHVSWIPSYGPEMRGGAANCSVVISDAPIGSPIVDAPKLALVMNLQSKEKFEDAVVPGGDFIINSSLVPEEPKRNDVNNYLTPLNDVAGKFSNPRVLNLVALGAVYEALKPVKEESIFKALSFLFGKKFAEKPELLKLNQEAFLAGRQALQEARK